MIIILVVLTLLILTIVLSIMYLENVQTERYFEPFVYEERGITLEEFGQFYNQKGSMTRSSVHEKYDGPGVYVLYNRTLDKYYFGQGGLVIEAINERLEDEVDSNLQTELENQHDFYLKMMLLEETSFDTLAELEYITQKEFLSDDY